MSDSLRGWIAVIVAPLVIAVWFLWPVVPFNHSPGEIVRSVATAYAFFFLTRGLVFLLTSRASTHFAFIFLFAFLISFSVSVGLTLSGIDQIPFGSAALGALQDAFWCTVAAAAYALIAGRDAFERRKAAV